MATFFSGGALVSSFTARPMTWSGTTDQIPEWVARYAMSYEQIYRRQPWVATLVDKIAVSHARLPFKVYERDRDGGRALSDSPFARLMAKPCPGMSNFQLWQWTTAMRNIHGNAFWVKVRDRGGRPVAMHPRHPSRVVFDGDTRWWYLLDAQGQRERRISRRDLVHFRTFSPTDGTLAGTSPLESLRSTLENEEGARQANSAMWRNGGRPSVVLKHSGQLSDAAATRLSASWDSIHRGVDNWGKTAILEEGLEPHVIPLNNEELAYIESRKLNREEVCARFDIPPPVVHILDRATFSNITEQMRSMYRDSMGWRVNELEDTIEAEVRDGSFGNGEPDFGSEAYGRFLMDEVLRGSFEARTQALREAEWMTIAEKRAIEDLPFIEGTDRIFVNSASLPLTSDGSLEAPASTNNAQSKRTLMGRLGRVADVSALDVDALVDGLDEGTTNTVLGALARTNATDVAQLRDELVDALNAKESP